MTAGVISLPHRAMWLLEQRIEEIMDSPIVPSIRKMQSQTMYFKKHAKWYDIGQMVLASQWYKEQNFRVYQDGTLVVDTENAQRSQV